MRPRTLFPSCVIVSILILKLLTMLRADVLSVIVVSLVGTATFASWLAGLWWTVSTTGSAR